jgi:hypothetical protein
VRPLRAVEPVRRERRFRFDVRRVGVGVGDASGGASTPDEVPMVLV